MKEELGVDVQLIKGHSGIFEIAVAGKVVAAKGRTGFPSEQEVVDGVSKALGTQASSP